MVEEAPRQRYPACLLSSTALSPRATLIRILVEERYEYQAGQFVALSLDDTAPDSYYSFASAPEASRPSEFELCLATVGKPELQTLKPGQRVFVGAPRGGVSFSARPAPPLWLIGIGTGVAPLRAITQSLGRELFGVTLVVGHRDVRGSLFHDEFVGMSRHGLDYRPFVSQEPGEWSGGRGRIQEEVTRLIGAAGPDVPKVHAVVCGKQDMAVSISDLLRRAGVPENQVHQEGH